MKDHEPGPIDWEKTAKRTIIALICLFLLASIPWAKIGVPVSSASLCSGGEALFSGAFWTGASGSAPSLHDLLDPCYYRGILENTPRCPAGDNQQGTECIHNGWHSIGNGKQEKDQK